MTAACNGRAGGLAARGGAPARRVAHGAAEGAARGAHRARGGWRLGRREGPRGARRQQRSGAQDGGPRRARTGARTGAREVAPPAVAPPLPTPSAGGGSFHDARTANEVLKAQERRLRLDERKGKLVDKRRALLLVHRLAKEERDAILAWPARVAAEMAAELGVDAHRLQTMMDARLREHLAARHDVRVSVG